MGIVIYCSGKITCNMYILIQLVIHPSANAGFSKGLTPDVNAFRKIWTRGNQNSVQWFIQLLSFKTHGFCGERLFFCFCFAFMENKNCNDKSPFCGASGTLRFSLRLTLPMGFKVRVDALLPILFSHLHIMILSVNCSCPGQGLVPGMVRLPLECLPNVTSRTARGRFEPTTSWSKTRRPTDWANPPSNYQLINFKTCLISTTVII